MFSFQLLSSDANVSWFICPHVSFAQYNHSLTYPEITKPHWQLSSYRTSLFFHLPDLNIDCSISRLLISLFLSLFTKDILPKNLLQSSKSTIQIKMVFFPSFFFSTKFFNSRHRKRQSCCVSWIRRRRLKLSCYTLKQHLHPQPTVTVDPADQVILHFSSLQVVYCTSLCQNLHASMRPNHANPWLCV